MTEEFLWRLTDKSRWRFKKGGIGEDSCEIKETNFTQGLKTSLFSLQLLAITWLILENWVKLPRKQISLFSLKNCWETLVFLRKNGWNIYATMEYKEMVFFSHSGICGLKGLYFVVRHNKCLTGNYCHFKTCLSSSIKYGKANPPVWILSPVAY